MRASLAGNYFLGLKGLLYLRIEAGKGLIS